MATGFGGGFNFGASNAPAFGASATSFGAPAAALPVSFRASGLSAPAPCKAAVRCPGSVRGGRGQLLFPPVVRCQPLGDAEGLSATASAPSGQQLGLKDVEQDEDPHQMPQQSSVSSASSMVNPSFGMDSGVQQGAMTGTRMPRVWTGGRSATRRSFSAARAVNGHNDQIVNCGGENFANGEVCAASLGGSRRSESKRRKPATNAIEPGSEDSGSTATTTRQSRHRKLLDALEWTASNAGSTIKRTVVIDASTAEGADAINMASSNAKAATIAAVAGAGAVEAAVKGAGKAGRKRVGSDQATKVGISSSADEATGDCGSAAAGLGSRMKGGGRTLRSSMVSGSRAPARSIASDRDNGDSGDGKECTGTTLQGDKLGCSSEGGPRGAEYTGQAGHARATRASKLFAPAERHVDSQETEPSNAVFGFKQQDLSMQQSALPTSLLIQSPAGDDVASALAATGVEAAEVAGGSSRLSTLQTVVRGRVLTGLRTVVSRPGRRRTRSGGSSGISTGGDAMQTNPDALTFGREAEDAPTVAVAKAVASDAARPISDDAEISQASNAALFDDGTLQFPGLGPSLAADELKLDTMEAARSDNVNGSTVAAADASGSPALEAVLDAESGPGSGTSGVSSMASGDGAAGVPRRQISVAEREARLKELFDGVDGDDEASATRSRLRRIASATTASSMASSSAATVPTGTISAKAFHSGDDERLAEGFAASSKTAPAGRGDSVGGRHSSDGKAPYRGGSHWDDQFLEDEFAGMAALLDFGADCDRAVQQRPAEPATNAVPSAEGTTESATAEAFGVLSPTRAGPAIEVSRGPGRSLHHDLAMGSVWLDDSNSDEGGHRAPSFSGNTGLTAAVGGGRGGDGDVMARRSRVPSSPPGVAATAAADTAATTPASAAAMSVPRISNPRSDPRFQGWADDLDDFFDFAGDSSDGGGGGIDLNGSSATNGSNAAAYGSVPSSIVSGLASSASVGVSPSLPYDDVNEDDLFGFDFSYVAPVSAQAPLQLLAASPASAAPSWPVVSGPSRNQRWRSYHEDPARLPQQHPPLRRQDGLERVGLADDLNSSAVPKEAPGTSDAVETHRLNAGRMEFLGRRDAMPVRSPPLQIHRARERERVQELEQEGTGAVGMAAATGQVRFRKMTRGLSSSASSASPVLSLPDGGMSVIGIDAAAANGKLERAGDVLLDDDGIAAAGGAAVGSSVASVVAASAGAPAIAFRRGTRGTNGGEPAVPIGGAFVSGSSSSSSGIGATGSSSTGVTVAGGSSSSSAAVLLQELLAPMRRPRQPASGQRTVSGSSSSSNGKEGSSSLGVDVTDGGDGRFGAGRRSGGYLTPIQEQQLAMPAQAQLQPEGGPRPATPPGGWKPRGTSETTLFVKGLDPAQGEERLRESLMQLFSSAGRIVQIRLPCDSRRLPKGIAYVVFESPEEKVQAVFLDGRRLLGRVIRVDAEVDRQA